MHVLWDKLSALPFVAPKSNLFLNCCSYYLVININQSISLRTLHSRLLHPAPSPATARLAPPTPARIPIPRHSPTPSFTFFPHLAGARGKATGVVLEVLHAISKVDARHAALHNGSCSASSNTRRVPALGKSAAASLDEDIPGIDNNIIKDKDATNIVGPVTRKRAKQLEKEIHSQVNANLILFNDNISDHSMLPSCCLNILRNDGICARAWDEDGFNPPTLW